ncbi:MAG: hypothetical protein QOD99_3117 [Chthoniobacter sp.]|jgi:hypothetical protein|nr:hypothetical protein [Chthoniobacter sp.]
MVQLLEQLVSTRRHPNLILHCGANKVERREVEKVPTPRATSTWTPIPHLQLIQRVEKTLAANQLTTGTFAHSLSHDGARYFGLMEVTNGENSDDYCWVLGLRNSHDKTFPAGVVAGASVFVCDNLSFSGEMKLSRKHTTFIVRDLPMLVERGIGRMLEKWHDQHVRFDAYKNKRINELAAHDLIIRATDVGVCSNRLIPNVLHQWREPEHEQFETRNVWSLFNAFTAALKEGSLAELPKRTEALHGLLDSHVGLAKKFSTS